MNNYTIRYHAGDVVIYRGERRVTALPEAYESQIRSIIDYNERQPGCLLISPHAHFFDVLHNGRLIAEFPDYGMMDSVMSLIQDFRRKYDEESNNEQMDMFEV